MRKLIYCFSRYSSLRCTKFTSLDNALGRQINIQIKCKQSKIKEKDFSILIPEKCLSLFQSYVILGSVCSIEVGEKEVNIDV